MSKKPTNDWKIGPYYFEVGSGIVRRGEESWELGRGPQFRLLLFVAEHYDEEYTKDQIIGHVWEGPSSANDASLHKAATQLRRILKADAGGSYLQKGSYRLSERPLRVGTPVLRQPPNVAMQCYTERPPGDNARSREEIRALVGDTGGDFTSIKPEPSKEARNFAAKFNALDHYIDGWAIEVYASFNLDSGFPLAETGWPPEMVDMALLDAEFDNRDVQADEFLRAAFGRSEEEREQSGRRRVLDTVNGPKYSLVEISPNVPECPDHLSLAVRRIDYHSVMRALPGILLSAEKRQMYGHVEPSCNRVPHSLGNHFLAILGSDEILAIQRGQNLDYARGKWSFSGEEQCFTSDLIKPASARAKHYLLRTAVEEIFPLGTSSDEEQLSLRTQFVERCIRSMRIWGVLLEETCVCFSLFSVFDLALSRTDYLGIYDELIRRGLGQRCGEGYYYTVSIKDALRLLQAEPIQASALFGNEKVTVSPGELHPTSRYRLSRFLAVLARLRSPA